MPLLSDEPVSLHKLVGNDLKKIATEIIRHFKIIQALHPVTHLISLKALVADFVGHEAEAVELLQDFLAHA